jgi:indolepyruvate ferredoxin oxidoreductase beta subunit
MTPQPKALTIAILAMGGEGGGVLAEWIADVAERGGYYVQMTSVPGVAQRTGSTIYYLEMLRETAGQAPVLALMPVPGEVDIVIASELMEAGRAIQRGLVTPDRTTLIASTHRVYSMTEKTATGDGRVDSAVLLEGCAAAARRFVRQDFARIASETGSVVSAALFGALAACGALPFPRELFEEAIRRSGVGVEASLAAFATGWGGIQPAPCISPARAPEDLGYQRLTDYQDARYAAEYLRRLEPIRNADRGDGSLLDEVARNLALWMSYEDAIRVADLKIRRARFERVRQEVRAAPPQLVEIHEFLHPRVEEIADILPARLGRWLLETNWVRRLAERFTRHGRVVQTTSFTGFLQLYLLAGLRRWRRKSLRFQNEQARINQWLAAVLNLARQDYALAKEVAELPRLLKGYGDTYARGRQEFDAAMSSRDPLGRGLPPNVQ